MPEQNITWPVEIEQYERKIYDLKQILEISKGLSSTLDYNTLIDSILLTLMGQMQLLKAGIFLRKGVGFDNFTLHRNYKGFEIDHTTEYEIISLSETVRFIAREFRCFTLEDLIKGNLADSSFSLLKMLDPGLIVPLVSKGELNGIMILGERIKKVEFSPSEMDYVLQIASLAGIAIHNARLYDMATTDMMTKLKIHHFFQATLNEIFEKSLVTKKPLSLIMADIDHFKDFNDRYGHITGDSVLKMVAQVLMENIRPSDTAARYGGEEFAVIMPKTEITEALIAAERIRESIANVKLKNGDDELGITISIGISQLDPESDRVKEDLISRTDRALYVSKKNGRNRVSFL